MIAGAADGAALTPREHRRIAELLYRATDENRPTPTLELYPELTDADVAAIDAASLAYRVRRGETVIGARSSVCPEGTTRLTWLTDAMFREHQTDGTFTHGAVTVPCLGFVLRREVTGSAPELLENVSCVRACLEVLRPPPDDPLPRGAYLADGTATVIGLDGDEVIGCPTEADVRRAELTAGAGSSTGASGRALPAAIQMFSTLLQTGVLLPAGFMLLARCGAALPDASRRQGTRPEATSGWVDIA
ncbi:hypothetical protein [Paraconexibacter sp. AEG42_29]|uniref:hypothetical protein n=1 Tax=Paraconexibacter sp. AEG42_29 TaxID=2997339 RepID=UPI00339D8D76